MESIREKNINIRKPDDKNIEEQHKGIGHTYSKNERLYRVVSDENSIYEYDLDCVEKLRNQ